jgi:D-sedoheptulose 7-phosphate isomerase
MVREEGISPTGVVEPVPVGAAYHGAVVAALTGRRTLMDGAFAQLEARAGTLAAAAGCMLTALRLGRKVLVAGNGGSAAEAQHLAAELVGRFRRERAPYAAIALTTDSSILTAVANDYGYDEVFARQVRGLGQPGDVFIAFSTSGESESLIRAAVACREGLIAVISVTGERPNRLERMADVALRMPVLETPAIQELHMAVTHILCDIVETELTTDAGGATA